MSEELPILEGHPADDRFGRNRSALRLPQFLKKKVGKGSAVRNTRQLLRGHGLTTVCEEARCPNLNECFSNKTATFMLLGENCTRACGFCAVGTAMPEPPDVDEPFRVSEAAAALGLEHVVLTSVNRDDLADGGAAHFAATIEAIRTRIPKSNIEVLTPDFDGCLEAVDVVAKTSVNVFNHNIETVPRLYKRVRPRARYERSLAVLRHVATNYPDKMVKSGMMVGLGESLDEVFDLLRDLAKAGVDIVTIGQYLRPSLKHVPVEAYLQPEAYDRLVSLGEGLGFKHIYAGPFVRSSYNAREAFVAAGLAGK